MALVLQIASLVVASTARSAFQATRKRASFIDCDHRGFRTPVSGKLGPCTFMPTGVLIPVSFTSSRPAVIALTHPAYSLKELLPFSARELVFQLPQHIGCG